MKHLMRVAMLLSIGLISPTLAIAQDRPVSLSDLDLVLGNGQTDHRAQVLERMQAFYDTHGVHLLFTLLQEDDVYQTFARQHETTLLQHPPPTLVLTLWHAPGHKAHRRHAVQLNDALAPRLPLATAQQLVSEALDTYAHSTPIYQDAMQQSLTFALDKLSDYLQALPPPEALPTITFANAEGSGSLLSTGLDAFTHEAHRGLYDQLEVHQEDYPVAWKALSSGQSQSVLAQVDEGTSFPPGVVFKQNGSVIPSQPTGENHQQQLTLTGQAHEQEGSVEVYASDEEDAELVGKLNTISYQTAYKKLVLVPLGRSISRGDLLPLVQRIARIYQPAALTLEVDVSEPLMIEGWEWDHALDDGTTGLLANYTAEMRQVIRALKQERDVEEETAYIFLCYQAKSGTTRGYMPKKRAYGFVFDALHRNDEEVAKTIAHELGHGLFRLKHTFEEYPNLTKGSTDNLMDYTDRGTRLHKYQWDFIHNPEAMLGWFQDDEENAIKDNSIVVKAILDKIREANADEEAEMIDFTKHGVKVYQGNRVKLDDDDTYQIVAFLKLENHKNVVHSSTYQLGSKTEAMGRKGNFARFELFTGTTRTVELIIDNEHAAILEDYLFGGVSGTLSVRSAINSMKAYLGNTYEQESGSLRTGNEPADLEKMDCSEFVSRYLQKVTGSEEVPKYTTASLTSFITVSNSYLAYIPGSRQEDFKDIQPGDIFLWRERDGDGHTGIVMSYNSVTDKVEVIEAIGSWGSREESFSKSISGYCKKCVRRSIYSRTGKALYNHDGWKGYFRPKVANN